MLIIIFITACSDWQNYVTDRYPAIPEEFYYQTTGSCEKGNLSFQVLIGAGAQLWDVAQLQSLNDILTGQVVIYLNRDLTYTVNYREFDFYNQVISKTFTSSYSFDPETQQLFLKDVGVATIGRRRNKYYLRLTFTANINSNLLAGQTIEVWLRSSYKGLDTDRLEYCSR